jgi:hypothetical protein
MTRDGPQGKTLSRSSGLIGLRLALEPRDLVFQQQFAALHAPQLQLIVRAVSFEGGDRNIKIPVFNAKHCKPTGQLFAVGFRNRISHDCLPPFLLDF